MRIALVCADPGVPVFAGRAASAHLLGVLRALRAAGHEVTLFTPRPGGLLPPDLEGLPVRVLPRPRPRGGRPRAWDQLAINHHLRAALIDAGPFDLVYERHATWSYAAMDWAARAGVPSVLEVNDARFEWRAAARAPLEAHAVRRVVRRAVGAARTVLAVSPGVARELTRRVGAGRLVVVPNGVDPGRFTPSATPRLLAGPVVGYLGALTDAQGATTLLEAFREAARHAGRLRLLLVGEGPERERLEARAAEYGLADRVHFAGEVTPDEVPAWLATMDVAVAPYPAVPGVQPSSLKLLEYMAAGRAVVTTTAAAAWSLVQHECTGLVTAPDVPGALAAAILRLLADPALAARLGANARATVARGRGWSPLVAAVEQAARLPLSRPLRGRTLPR